MTYLMFVSSVAATASIKFLLALSNGNTVTMVDTAGTSKTYTVATVVDVTAREFEASTAGLARDTLVSCINASAGHNGTITAVAGNTGSSTGLVSLTQAAGGLDGNTSITRTGFNDVSGIISQWSGGLEAGDDAACYHEDRLISMTGAFNATLLLNFESSGSGSTAAWSHGHDIITLTITADTEQAVMERIISETNLYIGEFIVIADDVKRAGTGSINFLLALSVGTTVTMVDTAGTSKTYTVATSVDVTAREFEASTPGLARDTLVSCINASDGHNGTITASAGNTGSSTGVVSLTQAVGGLDGNTTITRTGWNDVSGTIINFDEGTDGQYVDSRITACSIALDT